MKNNDLACANATELKRLVYFRFMLTLQVQKKIKEEQQYVFKKYKATSSFRHPLEFLLLHVNGHV